MIRDRASFQYTAPARGATQAAIALIASLALSSLLSVQVPAWSAETNQRAEEYVLKAAILKHIALFVEWPDDAFAGVDSPFVLTVFGVDPFERNLDEALSGNTVNGRPVAVRRTSSTDEARRSHMIFICRSERDRIDELVAAFDGRALLTVSDIDGFCEHGGALNLVLHDRKISIEINPGAVTHNDLKMSSKLLRLGRIVTTTGS